jgi:uncharacterized membrane protein YbhN (UPF0104 family)
MSGAGKWGRKLLAAALVVAAVAFIARTVVTNSRDLATFEWRVRGGILVLSVVAHIGVLAWGVFVWSRVLRHFAVRDTSFPSLLRIWAFSNAARYIPGVVWQFVAAARLAAASGLSQVVTLSSMLVHVMLSLTSACVVAVATLPLARLGLAPEVAWFLRIALPVAAVGCAHPAWINLGLRMIPRALHREVLVWHGRWTDGIGLLALATVSWALYGVAYYLFLLALKPIPLSALPDAAGVNALSFVAGYLAIPAPGGLGVRESAMTLLLTPLFPAGVAAVVAVAARLWSIVAEVGLAAIATLLRGGPRGSAHADVAARRR